MLSDAEKLAALIEDIRIAIVTTVEPDGTLHSRPLQTLRFAEGMLWFFTALDSAKVQELRRDIRVSVAYAHPPKNAYVTVAGTGAVLKDLAKAQELWTPFARAFFPAGVEDPRLALLQVHVERAEIWTGGGMAAQLFAVAWAAATGEPVEVRTTRKLRP
ncbi:MAG TPA: pyridoxamine 5'-phosphate oxidase family protein [Povalibacter sp.]|nr:pyridoxamine 5'-phosphate oxidase family protein [Povalibacter sp.]